MKENKKKNQIPYFDIELSLLLEGGSSGEGGSDAE
jgi:hypothetical protein